MKEYKVSEDSWYKYKGVKPPERISHGLTEEEVDEKIADALREHKCVWRQRGPEVYCDEGQNIHGFRVGVHKRLMESRDGVPILKDV